MYTKVVLSSHMGLGAPRLEGQLLRAPSAIRARHLLAVDRTVSWYPLALWWGQAASRGTVGWPAPITPPHCVSGISWGAS